jgi:hypothetical protein
MAGDGVNDAPVEHQELLSGVVRLHVLHHAAEGDLYGNWMIEELALTATRSAPARSTRCCMRSNARVI